MSKHTPGPWHVLRNNHTQVRSEGESFVCDCQTVIATRRGEDEANAAFIAVAPDMLAFIRFVRTTAEHDSLMCKEAQALLARIEGKP